MKTNHSYLKYIRSAMAIFLSLSIISCGGGGSSGGSYGTSGGGGGASTPPTVSTFSINGATGVINQASKTIAVSLPFGTAVTALVATFSAPGSNVTVAGVTQASGITANNFSSPLAYVLRESNGDTATYAVTVTPATVSAKALTSFVLNGVTGTINEAAKTIGVIMPYGTAVSGLVSTFSVAGSTVTVGNTIQASGITPNNFTNPVAYVVTAADSSTATYTVAVSVSAVNAKALTNFSLNGIIGTINEGTKTIGVVMPSGSPVTSLISTFTTTGSNVAVGSVTQVNGMTANNFTAPVAYVVTAGDNSSATYTVTVTQASASSKAFTSYGFALNGAVGTINETAKTIGLVLPFGSAVNNLIATFSTTGASVNVGGTLQVSGTTANNFTNPVAYVVTAIDNSTATYTVAVTVAASSAKAFTSFSLNNVIGTINESTKTIGVVMPFGTAVTGLVATFTTTGTSVKIGSTPQVTGATANNFTSPVAYVVTAADNSVVTYTVAVTAAPSSAKALTNIALNGISGTINQAAQTIEFQLPSGTAVTGMIATFTTTGSRVAVSGVTQVSGATANNFTFPVVYVVTAADGSSINYTLYTIVLPSTAKAITSFSLNGVVGTINESLKTIAVAMPTGTSTTGLIATFATTGTSVAVAGVVQVSGATANTFTSPVVYVVSGSDSSTTSYSVTVSVVTSSAKALTSYALNGFVGTINPATQAIAVSAPSGTAVTSLVATFTTTGTSVNIGGTLQVSGGTSNNFTTPVTYTVSAADGSSTNYIVTVMVAAPAGPAPVALGNVGSFALFSYTGLSSTPDSAITGNVGVGSGVTSTAITTGFTLTLPGGAAFATAPQVTGNVYAKDYAAPTPVFITSATNDLLTAYNDAAGRTGSTVFDSAELGGRTLPPGLYSSPVSMNLAVNTTLTLNGGPNDVWIIQVAGGVTTGANTRIALTGGAVAKNVFWQIQTALTVGATSTFNGVVMTGAAITVGANSTIVGRLLAQTAVTMNANTITQPAP